MLEIEAFSPLFFFSLFLSPHPPPQPIPATALCDTTGAFFLPPFFFFLPFLCVRCRPRPRQKVGGTSVCPPPPLFSFSRLFFPVLGLVGGAAAVSSPFSLSLFPPFPLSPSADQTEKVRSTTATNDFSFSLLFFFLPFRPHRPARAARTV